MYIKRFYKFSIFFLTYKLLIWIIPCVECFSVKLASIIERTEDDFHRFLMFDWISDLFMLLFVNICFLTK